MATLLPKERLRPGEVRHRVRPQGGGFVFGIHDPLCGEWIQSAGNRQDQTGCNPEHSLVNGPARPNGKPSEGSFSYGWNQEEMGDEGQTQTRHPRNAGMDRPALGLWEDAGGEPHVRSGLLRILLPSEGVRVSLCGIQPAWERPARAGCGSEGARPGVHFGDHQRGWRGYFDHKRIKNGYL